MAEEGGRMHILVISLTVAFVVCLLLLAAFWLFTLTPLARRIEQADRRHSPRTH
jgi:type II secretory pathway component PulM